MDFNHQDNFLFALKYRLWRHVAFWIFHVLFFALLFSNNDFDEQLIITSFWIPLRMVYCYPVIYWALPAYLLKAKYLQFAFLIFLWAVAAWYGNYLFRAYIFIPLRRQLGFVQNIQTNPWANASLLATMVTVFAACMVVLLKHWVKKQQEWLQAENEKVTAELQLLKAQVHPHFLFNTLNNIYSFSLDTSPKVANLIIKLSSLLRYILYSGKAEQVLLQKEIDVMKDYIDLEKERYGNNMEISLTVAGDTKGKYISPLLLLPFLENAFKHGTSDLLEKPWLSIDMLVNQNTMTCKIANGKNEQTTVNENGIGVQNVRKRLLFLYPDKHELKLTNGENFFVVALRVELTEESKSYAAFSSNSLPLPETI